LIYKSNKFNLGKKSIFEVNFQKNMLYKNGGKSKRSF